MRISDICTRNVVQIGANASVRDAADLMRRRQVGSLVVTEATDSGPIARGIITDRDVALSIVGSDASPGSRTVGETMTRSLVSCAESADIYDVLRRMRGNNVRRMPVLDDRGHLLGIVTADDVIGALSAHLYEMSQSDARAKIVNDPRGRGEA